MTGYGNIQSKQRGMRVLRRTAYCEASAILERVPVRALVRFEQGLWIRGIINAVLWGLFTISFGINYSKLPDK